MSSPDLSPGPLEENLCDVRQRIENAARAAGRVPGEIQLLPVTKAVDLVTTRALAQLGELELAENRADSLEAKALALEGQGIRWHFIGHLQRNKARRVVRHASVIHSVDSTRLVETLERSAREENRVLAIYLQVNFTGEDTKHGLHEDRLAEALTAVGRSAHLELLGLMAMAPLHESAERGAREVFERVATLAAELERTDASRFVDSRCRLSMGMSGDLDEAVRAGSTCVRVGGALFQGEPAS